VLGDLQLVLFPQGWHVIAVLLMPLEATFHLGGKAARQISDVLPKKRVGVGLSSSSSSREGEMSTW